MRYVVAMVFAFIFAAIACGFAALCYAEFASKIPIAGSAYTYAYASFGELLAWIICWDLLVEYAIGNIAFDQVGKAAWKRVRGPEPADQARPQPPDVRRLSDDDLAQVRSSPFRRRRAQAVIEQPQRPIGRPSMLQRHGAVDGAGPEAEQDEEQQQGLAPSPGTLHRGCEIQLSRRHE